MILTEQIRRSNEVLHVALRNHGRLRGSSSVLVDDAARRLKLTEAPPLELLCSQAGGSSNPLLVDAERRVKMAAERVA